MKLLFNICFILLVYTHIFANELYINQSITNTDLHLNGMINCKITFLDLETNSAIYEENQDIEFNSNQFELTITVPTDIFEKHSVKLQILQLDDAHNTVLYESKAYTVPYSIYSNMSKETQSVKFENIKNVPSIDQFSGFLNKTQFKHNSIPSHALESVHASKITGQLPLANIDISSLNYVTSIINTNHSSHTRFLLQNNSKNNTVGAQLMFKSDAQSEQATVTLHKTKAGKNEFEINASSPISFRQNQQKILDLDAFGITINTPIYAPQINAYLPSQYLMGYIRPENIKNQSIPFNKLSITSQDLTSLGFIQQTLTDHEITEMGYIKTKLTDQEISKMGFIKSSLSEKDIQSMGFIKTKQTNASQIVTGTLADARLSNTVSKLGQSISNAEITDLHWDKITNKPSIQLASTHLNDLADGSLSGTKVGNGINASHISTGTLADARLSNTVSKLGQSISNAEITDLHWDKITNKPSIQLASTHLNDLADGSLSGSKVGNGIHASHISTGTLADARLSNTVSKLGQSISNAEITDLHWDKITNKPSIQLASTHLNDLADGSLSGTKVGNGIHASYISTGTLADARLSNTVSKLGQSISNAEITDLHWDKITNKPPFQNMAFQDSQNIHITGGSISVKTIISDQISSKKYHNLNRFVYGNSQKGSNVYYGVMQMISGQVFLDSNDLTVQLPFDWSGGILEIHIGDEKGNYFQEHGGGPYDYNSPCIYKTTHFALTQLNGSARNIHMSGKNMNNVYTSQDRQIRGLPVSATNTSFTLKGHPTKIPIYWIVIAPAIAD